MKLQLKAKGSWKTVVEFDVARVFEVEDAAASLSRAVGVLRFAVLDDDGTRRHLNDRGAFRPLREIPGKPGIASGRDRTMSGGIGQP